MAVYGVATNNPFALLGDDELNDDAERLVDAAAAAKQKTPTAETTPPGRGARGRGAARGGRRSDAPVREPSYEAEYARGGDGSRGSYAGRGPRGTGRGRGAPPGRGKRQYDRRDGTGRGHEFEKRHGGGKGNWGHSTDTAEAAEATEKVAPGWELPEETTQDAIPSDTEGKTEQEGAPDEEETEKKEEPKEEPKVVLTLAEYEEMTKDHVMTFAPVKKKAPVVDKKQFDGMAVLKKSQEESGFEALEVEKIRKRREKREKEVEVVEVAFRVGEPLRRGRGRGRGRSRDFDRDPEGPPRFANGTDAPAGGPSELPRADSGSYPPRGRFGGRGRGGRGFRGRGEAMGRGGGRRGIDMNSENVFPSLTG